MRIGLSRKNGVFRNKQSAILFANNKRKGKFSDLGFILEQLLHCANQKARLLS